MEVNPEQLRWKPVSFPEKDTDFLSGIKSYCGAGAPSLKAGIAIHSYSFNTSMETNTSFFSSDGDFCLVHESGNMTVTTEFGKLTLSNCETMIIPRGIKFRVDADEPNRGYMCEVYDGHFRLPELGPIGANGLANARDFKVPVAAYEEKEGTFTVINKFLGKFFKYTASSSPFDVVAWQGNYYPFKYNCFDFNAMGSITYDHPDPSIFTCLTVASTEPGVAACDFVLFVPRWLVQEKTFRPPYYHRNTMSEFMGNLKGTYDAKENGFGPGAASLHSCMSGHGPERKVFEKASQEEQKPTKVGENGMAFMFESKYIFKFPRFALEEEGLDTTYVDCWSDLKKNFNNKD